MCVTRGDTAREGETGGDRETSGRQKQIGDTGGDVIEETLAVTIQRGRLIT